MEVSIVIPTRNRSELLRTTIRSALRQQHVEFELIVVDEGSTDETAELLADVRDARLRVIRHETPLGLSAARNDGAEEARGKWVAFLDDDDLWAPDKLMEQLHAAQETARDWVYTGSGEYRGLPHHPSRPTTVSEGGTGDTAAIPGSRAGARTSLSDNRSGARSADRHSLPPRWGRLGAVHSFGGESRPARVRGPSTDGQTDSFVQHVPRHC